MYFTKEKAQRYIEDLKKYIYQDKMAIKEIKFREMSFDEANQVDAHKIDFNDQSWGKIKIGEQWGGRDKVAWLRSSVEIPVDWQGEQVALYFILGAGQEGGLAGAESLLYLDGEPIQGLDSNHREVYLKSDWIEKGTVNIAIKAWSSLQNNQRVIREASLVKINQVLEDYYYRAATVLMTLNTFPEGNYDREQLLNFLNESINKIDFRKPASSSFYASVEQANTFLQDQLQAYKKDDENRPVVTAVGHSHIDVAWLWRLCHTREKCARTFSTVLHLMDQYPEYQFLQSSPQLYDYIKADYPEIFAKIKERVKSGEWEVTGGMWVEADCNVPSGESLVRQFLLGTRFMEEEFGVECNILWLPDVFGYSWALPQIIVNSGLQYFMTTKISWSQYNRPTYDTFNWRGLDGTEVLTHYITTSDVGNPRFYTYNGNLKPSSVKWIWENYNQKDINDQLLLAYGWGDGGGGPTKEMIEMGKKMQELPGIPEVKFGKAEPFFAQLAEQVKDNPKLPVVDGELYLEYHRGTYTSQGRTKKNNRMSEILFHNLELFNSLAGNFIDDYHYPQNEINEGWKVILRNQFHDILPGSSIHEVYEDSEEEFAQVLDSGRAILAQAQTALASQVAIEGERLVVFNPLSWARTGSVTLTWEEGLANKAFLTEDGEQLLTKVISTAGKKELMIHVPAIPALGYRTFKMAANSSANESASELKVSKERIENKYFIIKLNELGQISSLYDKEARREILPEGMVANQLQTFEDRPMMFDAWDIDLYYQEKIYPVQNLVEMEIEEKGPERAVIRFKWQVLDSVIEQRMIVAADQRRIDFKTEVDWQEHQILLKVAFPVDVRNTKATFEIQFGNAERPTHWNTSWDYAKFETVAQKWADLSERDYGVSLLNDCKYGYDIKDQTMRLTLIKSGIDPDREADQGQHSFTYSLYPHLGDWYRGGTTQEAYQLNYPLLAVKADGAGGKLPARQSLVEIAAKSVILDTVKQAEDDDALILRFYEYGNQRDMVRVVLPDQIKGVTECNLLEKEQQALDSSANSFEFAINPYQIKTFKVKL